MRFIFLFSFKQNISPKIDSVSILIMLSILTQSETENMRSHGTIRSHRNKSVWTVAVDTSWRNPMNLSWSNKFSMKNRRCLMISPCVMIRWTDWLDDEMISSTSWLRACWRPGSRWMSFAAKLNVPPILFLDGFVRLSMIFIWGHFAEFPIQLCIVWHMSFAVFLARGSGPVLISGSSCLSICHLASALAIPVGLSHSSLLHGAHPSWTSLSVSSCLPSKIIFVSSAATYISICFSSIRLASNFSRLSLTPTWRYAS